MKYIMTELPSSGVKNYIYFDYYSDLYRPMPEEPTMKMLGAIATVISATGNVNYYLCTLKENELVWEEIFDNENLRALIAALDTNLAKTISRVAVLESYIDGIKARQAAIELHLEDVDDHLDLHDSEIAALKKQTSGMQEYIDKEVKKVVEAVEAEEQARIIEDILLGKKIDSEVLALWLEDSELRDELSKVNGRVDLITSEFRGKISTLEIGLSQETQERLRDIREVNARIDSVEEVVDKEIVERKETDSELYALIGDIRGYVDRKVDSEHAWNVSEHTALSQVIANNYSELKARCDSEDAHLIRLDSEVVKIDGRLDVLEAHDVVIDAEIEALKRRDSELEATKQDNLQYIDESVKDHYAWGTFRGKKSSFPGTDPAGRTYTLNLYAYGKDDELRYAVTIENTNSSSVYNNLVGTDGTGEVRLYCAGALVGTYALGTKYGCQGVNNYNWCVSNGLDITYIEQRDLIEIPLFIDVSAFGSHTSPETFIFEVDYTIPALGTTTIRNATLSRKAGVDSGILTLEEPEELQIKTAKDASGEYGLVTINGKEVATVYAAGSGVKIDSNNVISIDVNTLDVKMDAQYTVGRTLGGYNVGDVISKGTTLRDILVKLLGLN